VDELAFLKSVTEDDKNAPSPKRASGAQFQPSEPLTSLGQRGAGGGHPTPSAGSPLAQTNNNEDAEVVKTLKCKECGTMNLATEWYCESCGAELAAL
jgi:hypothetical protein